MSKWMNCFIIVLALVCCAHAQRGQGQGQPQEGMRFRFVGPAIGNRVAAIAGVVGDPNTYYAGAASGGVWKTSDGGNRWAPIFDSQPVAAIGALAVAPSDPNEVWAGTGEAWVIRDSDVMGNGIYKSTDAGKTWHHSGLDATGRIGRIIVHPTNPDIVFACAVGRATGPQQERGVFRTTDGGKTWQRVLFADEKTGCSGLAIDAKNPRVLFAGMWQVELHSWAMFSGGPGSGLYVSRDGGTTWNKIAARGLPRPPLGKIDVAVAPSNSSRVYALIQTADQGSMWRSDDGGENWRAVNHTRALIGRAGYYIRLAVSPTNDNEILVANSSFFQSLDGGETFKQVPWGGDNHDIWIDPANADRFALTNDAGLMITDVHGRGFNRVQLPIGQMYHVAVDNQTPYWVYTNMQDSSTMRGPMTSVSAPGFGAARDDWEHRLGGCESGFTYPDPTDPNIIWATCYGNQVTRYDARTKRARSVSPWLHTLDSAPNEAKYRCHWTPPLAIDPFDHNTVYYGCQVIFKTSDAGQSWSVISPDLSTQDPAHNVSSGGIVGDNLGQFYGEVVFAIAPSEIQKGLIWAGTNDGLVWNTRDGGTHWNNVTKNIGGLPAGGSITAIQPSHFDAGTAYVVADLHLADNRDPFLYKTTDFGATWTSIAGSLPKGDLAYARSIAEDPNRRGLLFAGTGNAFYYSLDDGAKWTPLEGGLPHAPVTWIAVQKAYHDVVVSTYGRGIYILDDITPLEEKAAKPTDVSVRLYTPRPTFRSTRGGRAFINYELKSAPKGPIKLEILDAQGGVVREIRSAGAPAAPGAPGASDQTEGAAPGGGGFGGGGFGAARLTARPGLNRFTWDMRYEPPRLVALRTTPAENTHIWEEPRFRGADSRPITHWGIQQAQTGPIVTPGKYSAKLTVDGEAYVQPLEIVRDPMISTPDADLQLSVKTLLRIRNDITAVSDMVNRIEWMRKQLEDVQKMLRGKPDKSDAVLKTVEAMDQKMQDVEYRMFAKWLRASDDKYYIEAYKLYLDLIWLNGEVGTGAGDVAGGADYRPTDTSIAMLADLEKELKSVQGSYKDLMDKEVVAFNKFLTDHAITPLVSPPAATAP